MKKPNILWICTDQQRIDTLNCYGNNLAQTPNIDGLAKKGTLFEKCYCQSPVCTPSRASFMTGRYPRTTRCRQNGQNIPSEEKLISKILDENGYICGLSGKLHLSACHPSVCKGMEKRIDDGYSAFHWSHGGHDGWPTHEYFQWLRENGQRFISKSMEETNLVEYGMDEKYHQTTWCTNKAINFIEANAEYNKPWMFSVNIYDPHHPFDPPKKYIKKYIKKLNDIPLPNYVEGELEDKPLVQKKDHKGAYGSNDLGDDNFFNYELMSEHEHKLIRAAYLAMAELIDKNVGRLLASLKKTGQLENTIVIFMSDHGEMLGDHGIYLKGPYFYDPLIKVPLIISWSKVIKEDLRSKALVELVDIAPTIMELVNIKKYEGMQGKSIKSLLTGEIPLDKHKELVYSEYYNAMPWHDKSISQATMIADRRYKLVRIHSTKDGELYDLIEDPNETNNLWNNHEYCDIKLKYLEKMCDKMAQTVDPLPSRIAPW